MSLTVASGVAVTSPRTITVGRIGRPDRREGRAIPTYMDRHELTGTTAEEVARAHLKDLAIQDRYGVRFLTYLVRRGALHDLLLGPGPRQRDGQPCSSRG